MQSDLITPLRFVAIACGLVLVTACAGRDVTAPTRTPAARRPETLVPAEDLPMLTVSNSSFFDPPPNSSPSAISALAPVEFGGIPDSTWVVISVTGDVQQRWNPECDTRPPYWPCQTGSVLTTPFGMKPWDEGAVKMWANQNGVTSPIKLRGQGGENTTTAIGLKFFASGGTLLGRVNAYPKWAWDPNFGTGPFSYYLSGGYQVDAMPVASPVSLTASPSLDSVGTRQYTIQPLYGLKFINPLDWSWTWPDGAIFWYFIPGDSVGPKPGWSEFIDIPECRFQQVCDYQPPGPGRMQAATYVETQYVVVRSPNVCEAPTKWDGEDTVDEETPVDNCGAFSRLCPMTMFKVVTAGIVVAGQLHTFKFNPPISLIPPTRVPGTYAITPTVSTDGWWIAESGHITVDCEGVYIRIPRTNKRLWIGHPSYRSSDLHMVMGPSHPDFHNTQPEGGSN